MLSQARGVEMRIWTARRADRQGAGRLWASAPHLRLTTRPHLPREQERLQLERGRAGTHGVHAGLLELQLGLVRA